MEDKQYCIFFDGGTCTCIKEFNGEVPTEITEKYCNTCNSKKFIE